jgi:hypothetical protein
VYTGFWWINLVERDHMEDLGVNGMIILNVSSRCGMGKNGLDGSE